MKTCRFYVISLFIVFLLFLTSCSSVPITGRSQLNLVSDRELIASSDKVFSQYMDFFNKRNAVMQPYESEKSAATIALVDRVSNRIVDAAGMRGQRNWQTFVIKSTHQNASVLPNGKIFVHTGILSVTETEAGLAAVIGHEVGHVVARHGAERLSQQLLVDMALTAANIAIASQNTKYAPVIAVALEAGALYGVTLPYSRIHEIEADTMGLYYMAKAGYDPAEAIRFWERMEARGGSGPWEFLSTHPSDARRRANIREQLPGVYLYYADQTRPLPNNLEEIKLALAKQSSTHSQGEYKVTEIRQYTRSKQSPKTSLAESYALSQSGRHIIDIEKYTRSKQSPKTSLAESYALSQSGRHIIDVQHYMKGGR